MWRSDVLKVEKKTVHCYVGDTAWREFHDSVVRKAFSEVVVSGCETQSSVDKVVIA